MLPAVPSAGLPTLSQLYDEPSAMMLTLSLRDNQDLAGTITAAIEQIAAGGMGGGAATGLLLSPAFTGSLKQLPPVPAPLARALQGAVRQAVAEAGEQQQQRAQLSRQQAQQPKPPPPNLPPQLGQQLSSLGMQLSSAHFLEQLLHSDAARQWLAPAGPGQPPRSPADCTALNAGGDVADSGDLPPTPQLWQQQGAAQQPGFAQQAAQHAQAQQEQQQQEQEQQPSTSIDAPPSPFAAGGQAGYFGGNGQGGQPAGGKQQARSATPTSPLPLSPVGSVGSLEHTSSGSGHNLAYRRVSFTQLPLAGASSNSADEIPRPLTRGPMPSMPLLPRAPAVTAPTPAAARPPLPLPPPARPPQSPLAVRPPRAPPSPAAIPAQPPALPPVAAGAPAAVHSAAVPASAAAPAAPAAADASPRGPQLPLPPQLAAAAAARSRAARPMPSAATLAAGIPAAHVAVVHAGTAVRIAPSAAAPAEEPAAKEEPKHHTMGPAEGPVSVVSVHAAPLELELSQGGEFLRSSAVVLAPVMRVAWLLTSVVCSRACRDLPQPAVLHRQDHRRAAAARARLGG
jgi:hypothetical protein